MRVVAGAARGIRLTAPRGDATRPTSDRVREAVFNALYSLGEIDGGRFIDPFAGTGALGIEALSRGAAHATFIERDRAAVACIEDNLDRTGLAERATVLTGTAEALVPGAGRHDVAVLDPPYGYAGWDGLLSGLTCGVAVVEAPDPPTLGAEWELVRERRYGGTVVIIARRRPDPVE